MAEHYLVLTAEEREYLANRLNSALSETRVEVHRTHTPAYRERVLHEEARILACSTGGRHGRALSGTHRRGKRVSGESPELRVVGDASRGAPHPYARLPGARAPRGSADPRMLDRGAPWPSIIWYSPPRKESIWRIA